MADIKFYCPHCQRKLGVDSSAAGYFVDCPECDAHIRIPEESTVEPPRFTLPPKPARRAQPSDPDVTQPITGILQPEADTDAGEKPKLTERIAHLEKERAAFEEALRREQARSESVAQLEAKIGDLLQQLESTQARVHQAEAKALEARKAKETIEQKLQEQTAKPEPAESSPDADLVKQVETLRTQLDTANSERDAARRKVTELEHALTEAKQSTDTVATLRAEKRDLQAELRKALEDKERAVSVESSVEEIRTEAMALASKLSEAETRTERLSAEKKELTERAATADRARMEAATKEQAAREELARLSEEKKRLEATIKVVKDKTEGIQGKIDTLEKQTGRVAELEARVGQLTEQNAALSASLKTAQEPPKPAAVAAEPTKASRPTTTEPKGAATTAAPSPKASKPPRLAPAAKEAGDRKTAPATAKKSAIPRPPTRLPKRAPRTGSMYRKVPRRTGRPPRAVAIAILAVVLLLLVGALLAFVFPELTARWTAPVRALFGGKPAGETSGLPGSSEAFAQNQPDTIAATEGPGASVTVDEVEISMSSVKIEPVARLNALGQEVMTEQPYLVVEVSLKNTTPDKELFLIHGWDKSTLTDGLGGSSRPAFPSHFNLDRVVGTQGVTELAPGKEALDRVIFEAPAEEATEFTLLADPGVWQKTAAGRFEPVSDTRVSFTFTRNDIVSAP